ncbi:MAG: hypothetical protein COT92_02130 [Candidatus Doudnabacteria bacterium CG10_big_fil_rev_8_21_14_0_10_42_18]|uniref:Adenylate kinase n=1 Tax=Candidatus Doudnabacteria bacterium CG10_big_fil_rev_8_21_14_0_10_42_18 TaxID=1974552 RepID=A0A2H0VAU4_9BACT|nr:MAG: hypothetical protein COT92_02130 [Candidatus Doudnabacteria bacterium CG10_big_fil_rev_8_21_14_0_10_42_18]
MKSNPINIILLGDPAAGKATHGQRLIKKYPLIDLDMGKELRKIKNKNKFNLKNTLDKGKLTPTKLVRTLLHEKIKAAPKNKGILFNGTPKMLGEAKLVQKWLRAEGRREAILVYLSVPMKETIRRMRNRQEYFKGKFSKRFDDTDRALKNRLRYYRQNISQVVKFFKTYYPYKKISTVGSVTGTFKKVDAHVGKYFKDEKK